jgi:hypothetical protein
VGDNDSLRRLSDDAGQSAGPPLTMDDEGEIKMPSGYGLTSPILSDEAGSQRLPLSSMTGTAKSRQEELKAAEIHISTSPATMDRLEARAGAADSQKSRLENLNPKT